MRLPELPSKLLSDSSMLLVSRHTRQSSWFLPLLELPAGLRKKRLALLVF